MTKIFLAVGVAVLLWTVAALADPPVSASSYRLGVGDKIQLRVLEWRRTVGEVHEWAALKGEAKVGPGGNVSLPLLGPVKAAGLTTEELAAAVSSDLQNILKLTIRPTASIDIIQYRPFYILGNVNHPGEYPYRPGMTVLQAISIGGGLYRPKDPDSYLSTSGKLRVLRLQYDSLLARQARLKAQQAGATRMTIPAELQQHANDPAMATLIQREEALFVTQQNAEREALDGLNRRKALLLGEIGSLQAKIKNADQQVVLMRRELASTTSLVQRGLAIQPREFSLQQTMLETEGHRLDLNTAVLRAKEDIGRADEAIVDLRNKTATDIATKLTEIQQQLGETATRISTDRLIIGPQLAAATSSSDANNDPPAARRAVDPPQYVIVRTSKGREREFPATETTPVEPGDTIKVLTPIDG
ncbi:MAG TPA: polysaccharide biosynthesis/export family protein [Stellaceae bacterium]|nr:polysaccharide biosynthesis/export family protein [Stellaceae bacterium]